MKFYNTKKWLDIRASVLREAKYMDQLRLREGKRVPAETVHHIFPRDKYPEYELCRWNLIAISAETHELLHNRMSGSLSSLGYDLMMETAEKHDIPISKLFMVIGLPGSGKTTYVKRHLKHGLAYDLDYIAAAFRLTEPHSERHIGARKMAGDMARSFADNAKRYTGLTFIISAEPTIEEVVNIEPDAIVICTKAFNIQNRKDYQRLPESQVKEHERRIEEIKEHCRYNDIEIIEV